MMGYFAAILPFIYFWRFGSARLDRDFAPYAYTGVFGGYLSNGHNDVKPPLIHWGYKLWLWLLRSVNLSLERKLRLLPTLAMSLNLLMVNYTHGPGSAWALGLLWASPFAWVHMANTEWLTAFLLSCWFVLLPAYPIIAWFLLGLSVWVNQKNLAVIVIVMMLSLLDRGVDMSALSVVIPVLALAVCLVWIEQWRIWLFEIPKAMGKNRTLKTNTLGVIYLLRPWAYEFAACVPFLDVTKPWVLLPFALLGLAIFSKQIVPHHFILIAFGLAVAVKPSLPLFVGFGLVFLIRSVWVWIRPKTLYAATFPYAGGGVAHYGKVLDDSVAVEEYIRNNTHEGEAIQVIGFENQIYLNANRPAVDMEICEAGHTKGRPRMVIFSVATGWNWDSTGYTQVYISPLGLYHVFVRVG